MQQGKVDQAIAQYQKAVETEPRFTVARLMLANALLQRGKVDEAISQDELAVQTNPEYAEAQYSLGGALLQKGRVDDAISHYQQALQLNPDFAAAHSELAGTLLQKGRAAEAISHFQKALQLTPSNPSLQNNLAWLLATSPEASLRDGDKAVALARQASTLTGGQNPVVLHTLAAAFAEAGRFSEAVETAQRALSLAGTQSNTRLAAMLQSELKLYQAGSPFHTEPPR
jgi:tetratricopeptide (TPR) repeat protein